MKWKNIWAQIVREQKPHDATRKQAEQIAGMLRALDAYVKARPQPKFKPVEPSGT